MEYGMMSKHKWHKEIKAWLDGKTVIGRMNTHKSVISEFEVSHLNNFSIENHEFYIKPQPKEPQYLYVYKSHDGEVDINFNDKSINDAWILVGKIKLEQDDEST